MDTDIEIARRASLQPIAAIAAGLGIPADSLEPYGRHVAKLDVASLQTARRPTAGKLVLVTAVSPTPAGEGKTTTTVGLGDGLARLGHKALICLREPSLGPVFGLKGGAAGGGHAQVVPMEKINLHFTGDFHAITSAHNLLAAMLDNHIYWGNALGIDPRRIAWRRVLDMNDRALRSVVSSLGGVANGFPREDGFDITVASEVMAIFCLAETLDDLEERLGRIVVAETRDGVAVTAADLKAAGAMTVLLKDAFQPNLVQTLEATPALVHGGPFANIAHGCNSVVATRTALALADFVVTEAGFGADLGAEKFLNIKCRQAGLAPDAVVLVATVRALKMHGGAAKDGLAVEDLGALERGFANLAQHVAGLRRFGLDPLIAINHFATDTAAEHDFLIAACRERLDATAVTCRHWADGSAGILELAERVVVAAKNGTSRFRPLYPDGLGLADKIRTVARDIYGAADIALSSRAAKDCRRIEAAGFGHLPVCMAKTQYSFSTDPNALGAPEGHTVEVAAMRLAAGAGFVVVLCGDIRTMPGLPRIPAAESIGLRDGVIEGLF
ncbi:formate--tetrahydrofolate ligase [Lichenihabitans sp. Uapishka_5]|uniref:formate--tetrahydrofolate ligase n=1 Tax=Lichenihabitans sp. Uapishka_5 TaxID=3037302 RepID=UPI0029E7D2AF|nr:formate--tetrahydrofolate ligase [Lichenihabitans sp. Uapishka_5]MDX7950210.1 formate--tetrahydrofolate ligase [Lichenihabitans sp. Uapishka_5]